MALRRMVPAPPWMAMVAMLFGVLTLFRFRYGFGSCRRDCRAACLFAASNLGCRFGRARVGFVFAIGVMQPWQNEFGHLRCGVYRAVGAMRYGVAYRLDQRQRGSIRGGRQLSF